MLAGLTLLAAYPAAALQYRLIERGGRAETGFLAAGSAYQLLLLSSCDKPGGPAIASLT